MRPNLFVDCIFPVANLSGERCRPGFKASVVVYQGIIRFLQDVPLEESNQHLPSLQARSATARGGD